MGHRITAGAPKSLNNITSYFFSAVHLLTKDLRFEHGSAKLVSNPWAPSNRVTPLAMTHKIRKVRVE